MPRKLWIPLSILFCGIAWPSMGQDASLDLRRDQRIGVTNAEGLRAVAATPEMWFYEQERIRDDDPQQLIRRRAEQRGHQRRDRLASCSWYGISNSRPSVSATPWYGGYSANWGSNTFDPLRWRAAPAPIVVVRPVERY